MHALGKDADRVNALFITVDPERDTAAVMKDYLSSFDPHLRGATGGEQAIKNVEKEYRVYSKKVPTQKGDYSMDHSAVVYLMDKEGRFVAPFKLQPQAGRSRRRSAPLYVAPYVWALVAAGITCSPARRRRRVLSQAAQQADAVLAEEFQLAFHPPAQPVIDRERAQIVGLGQRIVVAGDLHRVVVERRDFVDRHAGRGEPARNMDIAQPLDVVERLARAGAGGGAGGRKASPTSTMPACR